MARSNTTYDSLFGSFGTLQGLKNAINILGLDVKINPANYPRAVEEANRQIDIKYPELSELEFRAAVRGEHPFTSKAVLNKQRLVTNRFGGHILPRKLAHDDTKAEYKGTDRVDRFFAHYGRKGMKRGMNIYNPNYKPIGEKAKTNKEQEAKEQAFRSSQRYATDTKRKETEAKNQALKASQKNAVEVNRREALLKAEAERVSRNKEPRGQRLKEINEEAFMNHWHNETLGANDRIIARLKSEGREGPAKALEAYNDAWRLYQRLDEEFEALRDQRSSAKDNATLIDSVKEIRDAARDYLNKLSAQVDIAYREEDTKKGETAAKEQAAKASIQKTSEANKREALMAAERKRQSEYASKRK